MAANPMDTMLARGDYKGPTNGKLPVDHLDSASLAAEAALIAREPKGTEPDTSASSNPPESAA
ncbi:hypothetical protein [Paraburkholderia terricola]|jgi:hypothetical protein|uniref:hypothetical protein n=1 Tax=Paraburkholderia terricola TaxID=169427 RepID=UPI003ECCBEC2